MIYKMDLKDSSDTMTFNLLETPIVDKDIEGAVDNVTLDGNQYTDYLYLKKQYIQKWAIMCPDEYDELRGFYTRQFEEGEVPSYRVYYGANVTRDYTLNGDYFQFNAEGIETGMTLSQLTGNAEQTTYSGKNLLPPTADWTQTVSNVKITCSNGQYTFSGTATANGSTTARATVAPYTIQSGDYFHYCNTLVSPNINIQIVFTDATYFATSMNAADRVVSLESYVGKTISSCRVNFASGNTFNGVAKPMILHNVSTTSAYEPYVGGTPAPNPSYPQPISTVTGAQTVTVTGKNLYNNDLPLDNKYLDASGNWVTSSYAYINQEFIVQPSTAYTWSVVSKTGAPNLRFGEFDASGTFIQRTLITANNQTITTTATTALVKLSADNTDQNKFNEVQLELGSTATAYEPYQGQEYEVNLGKNLFSISQDTIISNAYLNNNATLTFADLNSVSITATGTQGAQYLYRIISGLDSTKSYTFSFKAIKNVKGSTGLPYIRITTSGSNDGSTWTNLGFSGNTNPTEGETYSFAKTLTGYSQYRFMIFNNVDTPVQIGETTTFFDMQLEEGAQTSFAPYFTPIELAKIGTYQDRIYKEDGKWYIEKQIGKVVFNGSTTLTQLQASTNTTRVVATISSEYDAPPSTVQLPLCDYFTGNSSVWATDIQGTYIQSRYAVLRANNATVGATLDSFKSWLSTHNTTVYYALATPTTTEITDETLLSQLNFLASLYGGVNNISLIGTGAQGEMEVFIRDVMSVETDVVPEVPVRLTLTDDGVINACGCRRNVQLTMRETTE